MNYDELKKIILLSHNKKDLLLNNIDIVKLPPEIGQLNNLEYLDIDNNRLENLPPEIGQLNNLQILRINNNHLESLPPEIGQLENLQTPKNSLVAPYFSARWKSVRATLVAVTSDLTLFLGPTSK